MNSKAKLIGLVLITVVSITVVLGVYSVLQNRKLTATITAEATPSDVIISFNGKRARDGENKVMPGGYQIIFYRDGFKQETRQVTVAKGEKQYVGAVLTPTDPKYTNWYSEHPEDAKKAEGISSKSFDQLGINKLKEAPFLKSLPYVRASYRIDYGISQKYANDPSKFAIYISYETDKDKETALKWIRDQGTDPANLEIIYKTP